MDNNVQNQLSELMTKLTELGSHFEREQQFAKIAEERFNTNLIAFKKFYPGIAKSIEEFSTNSTLELFVSPTCEGNIREYKTGMPLYGKDPISEVEEQVDKQLNDPLVNHIDFSGYASVPDSDTRLHARHLKQLGLIVRNNKYEKLRAIPERFPTAVIFGIGLGYHLPILSERVQFDYIYLVEPSFENFYCSLFCIDWAAFLKKIDAYNGVLVFQLGASYQTFIDDLYRVTQDLGAFTLTKCFCYQHYPSKEHTELIHLFHKRLFEIHGGYGFYNDSTTAIAHTVANANHGMSLAKPFGKKDNPYQNLPVYVVGNGPSLDDSIDIIRETQSKVLIIAAGSALQTLLKNGITPDFHTLIERPKNTYDALLRTLPAEEYKKLNLLTMCLIYPDIVPLYNWVGMAGKGVDAGGDLLNYARLKQEGKPLTLLPFCNPLVSNTALSYALHMGFKEVYLFGVDNGYSADGRHHASDSDYYKGEFTSWKPHDANHELEGNLGGKVMSSNLLAISCQQMGRLLSLPRFSDVTCYNVGDGAKVEHSLPLKPELVLPEILNTAKEEVVDFIKKELFDTFKADNFQQYMDFSKYNEICEHLLSIAQEPIDSRSSALDNLRRQSRYLYSHRGTKYSHLHYVLEGEMLYFHCPIVSLLFSCNDEQKCLGAFEVALSAWCKFLMEAKEDLKSSWLEKCTMGFD